MITKIQDGRRKRPILNARKEIMCNIIFPNIIYHKIVFLHLSHLKSCKNDMNMTTAIVDSC